MLFGNNTYGGLFLNYLYRVWGRFLGTICGCGLVTEKETATTYFIANVSVYS